ncbi:hypothetical protein EC991_011416, partial [Linnemannia zychae]
MFMSKSARASNLLQMEFGLYLKSTRAPKRVIQLLSKIGLSVAPDTIRVALSALHREALGNILRAAQESPCFLLFDNLDFFVRAYDQSIDNGDISSHGALGTLVCHVISPNAPMFRTIPLVRPTVEHFLPSVEHMEHQKTVVLHHAINVIKEHAFPRARWSSPPCLIDPLDVRKTKTYPLPALPYNQSDLDGVYEALKRMMQYV